MENLGIPAFHHSYLVSVQLSGMIGRILVSLETSDTRLVIYLADSSAAEPLHQDR